MEGKRGLVMKEMAYWARKLLGRKWCGRFVSNRWEGWDYYGKDE